MIDEFSIKGNSYATLHREPNLDLVSIFPFESRPEIMSK
jgi:hypothetical protein